MSLPTTLAAPDGDETLLLLLVPVLRTAIFATVRFFIVLPFTVLALLPGGDAAPRQCARETGGAQSDDPSPSEMVPPPVA